MAYIDNYSAGRDSGFRQRLEVALVKAAVAIMAEAAATAGHAKRVALANNVLLDPERWADRLAPSAAQERNVVLPMMPTDAALDICCANLWNAWAGHFL